MLAYSDYCIQFTSIDVPQAVVHFFLNMMIPSSKSPGTNIDVFLRPLIDELKQLWIVGMNTYNVSRK